MPIHPIPQRAPRKTIFMVSCAALLLGATTALLFH
jgi:hypothetical protein